MEGYYDPQWSRPRTKSAQIPQLQSEIYVGRMMKMVERPTTPKYVIHNLSLQHGCCYPGPITWPSAARIR